MIVSLTLRELLYIDDHITLSDASSKDQDAQVLLEDQHESLRPLSATAKIAAPQDLIVKVMRAVHEGLTAPKEQQAGLEIELDIDEFDILILREIAQSDVIIEEEFIGVALKEKLYKAYLDKKAFDQDSQEIVDEFPVTNDGKDLTIKDVDMDEFKKHYDKQG